QTEPLVTFNGEHFLDQRARRPVARIVNGVTTELTWPRTVVRQGSDAAGRDVLYLVGPELDFHWGAFTAAVVGLARSWHVRMVVGLGAFPAPAPPTRPVPLAAPAPPARRGARSTSSAPTTRSTRPWCASARRASTPRKATPWGSKRSPPATRSRPSSRSSCAAKSNSALRVHRGERRT